MLDRLNELFKPTKFETESENQVAGLLNIILLVTFGANLLLGGYILNTQPEKQILLGFIAFLTLAQLGLLILVYQGYLKRTTQLYLFLSWLGITVLTYFLGGGSAISFIILIVIAALLLDRVAAVVVMVVSILTTLVFVLLEAGGLLPNSTNMVNAYIIWFGQALNFIFITAILYIAIKNLTGALQNAQDNEEALTQSNRELESLRISLEQRVLGRTRILELSIQIGRHLATILDQKQLVSEVVSQLYSTINYHHVYIYLFSEPNHELTMVGGTGQTGHFQLKKQHQLIESQDLINYVAQTNTSVLVSDITKNATWEPNLDYQHIKSEVAVPIAFNNEVLGVLVVQDDISGGVVQEDATLLQAVADQVAIALRNARIFTETEASLNQAREIQQRYLGQAWEKTRVNRQNIGRATFSHGTPTNVSEQQINTTRQQAKQPNKPVIVRLDNEQAPVLLEHIIKEDNVEHNLAEDGDYALVTPIALRDTIIGHLQMHGLEADRQWSESELTLINTVVDQVAQTAETLRLFEGIQEQASRERLIAEINERMRNAPNMETLMKITVSELVRLLGPGRTFVRLGAGTQLLTQSPPSSDSKMSDSNGKSKQLSTETTATQVSEGDL